MQHYYEIGGATLSQNVKIAGIAIVAGAGIYQFYRYMSDSQQQQIEASREELRIQNEQNNELRTLVSGLNDLADANEVILRTAEADIREHQLYFSERDEEDSRREKLGVSTRDILKELNYKKNNVHSTQGTVVNVKEEVAASESEIRNVEQDDAYEDLGGFSMSKHQ